MKELYNNTQNPLSHFINISNVYKLYEAKNVENKYEIKLTYYTGMQIRTLKSVTALWREQILLYINGNSLTHCPERWKV